MALMELHLYCNLQAPVLEVRVKDLVLAVLLLHWVGWDGNVNDVPQPPGTYIWIVIGKTIHNKTIKKQRTLILIR